MSTTNLSRRAMMTAAAAIAAVPAVTVAATALTPSLADTAPGADVELLKLGTKLDRVGEQWLAQRALDVVEDAAIQAKVLAVTGIVYEDAPKWTQENDRTGYWAVYQQVLREQSIDPDLERWGRILDPLWDLADKILARKATTPAGLAVQARAFALTQAEWWNHGHDESGDGNNLPRLFVERVCSFVNITPLPMEGG